MAENETADPKMARRRALLAAIHAEAKKQEPRGMDEDVYRDLVERVSGARGPAVRSAGACTLPQLEAVLGELRRMAGRCVVVPITGRPAGELSPLLGKIEALLADAGREWAYAASLAKRMCKVERLEWCSEAQLRKIVAALQIDADRHGRPRPRKGARRRR